MQQIMHYSSQHRHVYDISTSFSFACTNKSTMFARDDRAFSLAAVSLLGAISKFAFSFSKRMSIAILFSGLVRNAWILSFALFRSGRWIYYLDSRELVRLGQTKVRLGQSKDPQFILLQWSFKRHVQLYIQRYLLTYIHTYVHTYIHS